MDAEQRIRGVLENRPEVVFATLFGSRATGRARPDSDWDLAVFVDESLDAAARFDLRRQIAAALEPAVEVDIVVLNDAPRCWVIAPCPVASSSTATTLAMCATSSAPSAGPSMVHMPARSTQTPAGVDCRSSPVVDPDVFDRRLERLEQALEDLRQIAALERATLTSDRGLQAQAERWTQVAVEVCIDLANHVIADHGWPSPDTYRDGFLTLAERGVIDAALASRMAG